MAPITTRSDDDKIVKELEHPEVTGEKTMKLKQIYKALLSVKPTSTEYERAFSVAGSFKTKVRNKLLPHKLSQLWLKNFYLK